MRHLASETAFGRPGFGPKLATVVLHKAALEIPLYVTSSVGQEKRLYVCVAETLKILRS